ncbi:MAG TPA: hypothetical protein IAA03_02785 [Candidatus Ruminococcus avistercoris]|nr:hypothetical protein [Candidatus Ruminococcus avistercoris]
MRRRWLKLGGLLIIAIIVMCGFSPEIYAESEKEVMEIEVPVYHDLTETETEVSDYAQVLQKGAYLSGGSVKLVDKGSGKISIYGSTNGYQRCDTVYLNIYLERSTNGRNFYSYLSWEYSASNVSSLSKSFTKSVPKGYYYRLRGYHAAKEGGVKESTSTTTSGLYID